MYSDIGKLQEPAKRQMVIPPPLPPRAGTIHLTPYSHQDASCSLSREDRQTTRQPWLSRDPRSSSTHSLVPSESATIDKRTLLLIYIHGFMGTESSFQSFPAHVHNLLTITLAETHAVHTKIYPRYKSRKAIEFARDAFSDWLAPNESSDTDVVLLGHSMGGLLSAEVVLLPPAGTSSSPPFRHRILGTVNFDTPFLGMHPGVVISGLGSLFRPTPDPPGKNESSSKHRSPSPGLQNHSGESNARGQSTTTPSLYTTDSLISRENSSSYFDSTSITPSLTPTTSTDCSAMSPLTSPITDPNYNPPFPNDVRLPIRSGWSNALHFVTKHSDGLTRATRQYFTSHLEFGGCLADYNGLKIRYARIRALEDVNELAQDDFTQRSESRRRRRFVNYYTASTGRPKKPKTPSPQRLAKARSTGDGAKQEFNDELQELSLSEKDTGSESRSPRISVEEHGAEAIVPKQPHMPGDIETAVGCGEPEGQFQMSQIDSLPIDESKDNDQVLSVSNHSPSISPTTDSGQNLSTDPTETAASKLNVDDSVSLPPLPPIPSEPPPLDTSPYTSKDTRKLAEKDHARALKAYKQAVSNRARALKERSKLLEKRAKKARQKQEKDLKAEAKRELKDTPQKDPSTSTADVDKTKEITEPNKKSKQQRDKKFCMLPSKGADGRRDEAWVRVYMQGVDEVGAHCGLFYMGQEAYEMLVGDVGARIEEWVREDLSVRVVGELRGVEGEQRARGNGQEERPDIGA